MFSPLISHEMSVELTKTIHVTSCAVWLTHTYWQTIDIILSTCGKMSYSVIRVLNIALFHCMSTHGGLYYTH